MLRSDDGGVRASRRRGLARAAAARSRARRTPRLRKMKFLLGLPPDADGNGNYAFFDAANYALIQMTGGVTAIPVV